MDSIKVIASAWFKKLHLTDTSEELKVLAEKRVNVCVDCPSAKEGWLTKFVDGVLKNDELGSGIVCGVCGCPVQTKALAIESLCPLDKWESL